jgi:hypothetical protein
MKIGPDDSTLIQGMMTVNVRLHLKYRRKRDGAQFQKKLLIGVLKKPELPRPVAVYLDYRAQLQ